MAERFSKITFIGLTTSKQLGSITGIMSKLLGKVKGFVESTNYDNGKNSASHELLNAMLVIDSYFARAYYSWEWELIEKTNALIRQYFPERSDLR